MDILLYPFFLVLTYLSGSIPSGVIIAKWAKGIDPRKSGSNNPGSTNVARLCGFKYGVLTLVVDILKGFLPVFLATYLYSDPLSLSIIALIAIFGHLKSVFLKFHGGKGVATLIGALLPLVFPPLLCSAILCLLIIWRSHYVSLGALTMATFLPIFCLIFAYFSYIPLCFIVFLIIFWTHRENILRLAKNEEKVWLTPKSKQAH